MRNLIIMCMLCLSYISPTCAGIISSQAVSGEVWSGYFNIQVKYLGDDGENCPLTKQVSAVSSATTIIPQKNKIVVRISKDQHDETKSIITPYLQYYNISPLYDGFFAQSTIEDKWTIMLHSNNGNDYITDNTCSIAKEDLNQTVTFLFWWKINQSKNSCDLEYKIEMPTISNSCSGKMKITRKGFDFKKTN